MKRLISLVLSLLMMSCYVVAGAVDLAPADTAPKGFVWSQDSNGTPVRIISDEIDVPEDDPAFDSAGIMPLLVEDLMFVMYLESMSYSLYTTGVKSFVKNDLSGGYLKIYGILESANDYERVGLVYYDDGFHVAPEYLSDVDCGEYFTFYYPQSGFSPYYYYYGYAQNPYNGSGSYAGRVQYINAER